ncbi:hypothetical protein T484DRAFT_2718593 [Baffinella frigidus]|nr:hypothetical protein T484DRAFT_2718593 [Cryptophyta sp. CCMP2293]
MQLWTVWEGALVGTGIEDGGVVLVRCAWSGDGAGAAHEDAVFSALSAEQLGGAAEELVSLEDVIDVSVGHAVPYLLLRIAAPAAGDSRFAVVALADSSGWAPRVMLTFSVHGRPVGKAAPAEPSSVPAWYSARLIDGPGVVVPHASSLVVALMTSNNRLGAAAAFSWTVSEHTPPPHLSGGGAVASGGGAGAPGGGAGALRLLGADCLGGDLSAPLAFVALKASGGWRCASLFLTTPPPRHLPLPVISPEQAGDDVVSITQVSGNARAGIDSVL